MGIKIKDFNKERNAGYFENLAKGTQNIIREAIENATGLINNGNVWDSGHGESGIDEIECHSRDGFIPYDHNRGGLTYTGFSDLMGIFGSGYFPKAKASHDKIQQLIDDDLQRASEAYYEANQEKLDKLGVTVSQCTYHELEDLAKTIPELDGENERMGEFENEFLSGDQATVMYQYQVMYHGKDAKGVHSASVSAALNYEAPYHRRGMCELAKEIEIKWTTQAELKKKLRVALEKTAKAVF